MMYPLFSDEYFMNEALKEANKALEKKEIPVGAVIVAERQIIARGHNQTEALSDVYDTTTFEKLLEEERKRLKQYIPDYCI